MRLVCLWPGLAAAWHCGNLRGLVVSVVFGWTLSVLLIASFVWQEWFSSLLVGGLWTGLGVVWLVESVRGMWAFNAMVEPTNAKCAEAFLEAQQEYIQGNWFDAEAILLEVVHQKPRDAEALLLLVGVLRHTRRWQPALRRLNQLEFLEAASSWRYEIQQERALIERGMAQEAAAEDQPAEDAESVEHAGEPMVEGADSPDGTEPDAGEEPAAALAESENTAVAR